MLRIDINKDNMNKSSFSMSGTFYDILSELVVVNIDIIKSCQIEFKSDSDLFADTLHDLIKENLN